MSTIWFARRVAKIVSIETDAEWHGRVTALLQNRGLSERVEPGWFPKLGGSVVDASRGFDFALVDGTSRDVATALALSVVRPGGYIYLDNSDVPCPNTGRHENNSSTRGTPRRGEILHRLL